MYSNGPSGRVTSEGLLCFTRANGEVKTPEKCISIDKLCIYPDTTIYSSRTPTVGNIAGKVVLSEKNTIFSRRVSQLLLFMQKKCSSEYPGQGENVQLEKTLVELALGEGKGLSENCHVAI